MDIAKGEALVKDADDLLAPKGRHTNITFLDTPTTARPKGAMDIAKSEALD